MIPKQNPVNYPVQILKTCFFGADVPQLPHHTSYRGIIIFGQQSQLFLAAFTTLRINTAAVSPFVLV